MFKKMGSIRETFLYKMNNKDGEIDSALNKLLANGMVVTKDHLQYALMQINKYYKYPLKPTVMEAIDSGAVVPMMFPKGISSSYKIPTALPFFLAKDDTHVVKAIAIIDNYAQITELEDGKLDVAIDAKKLYCILEGALIARSVHLGYNAFRSNTTMYSDAAYLYANMFTRVLNKKYALNVDKSAYNKVVFLAAKFFMINILAMEDSDIVFNYALKVAGALSPIAIRAIDEEFGDNGGYASFEAFIKRLSATGYLILGGLEQLTVRDYIVDFGNMYGNTALYSLEHLNYFLFNIFSVVNGGFLNNGYGFDAFMGNSGKKLYGYISSTVRKVEG